MRDLFSGCGSILGMWIYSRDVRMYVRTWRSRLGMSKCGHA